MYPQENFVPAKSSRMKKTTLLFFCLFPCFFGWSQPEKFLFQDDFEKGLQHWDLSNPGKFVLYTTKDRRHQKIIRLVPGGHNTYMLLKGSENFKSVSIEGDVLFPDTLNSYFGVIYNYTIRGSRNDYGCIYIKGNDNYLRQIPIVMGMYQESFTMIINFPSGKKIKLP